MKSERVVSNPENHGWEEVNGKWIWASGRNTGHIVDGDTEGQIATWHDPANAWTPSNYLIVDSGTGDATFSGDVHIPEQITFQKSAGNAHSIKADTNDLVFTSITAGKESMRLTYAGNATFSGNVNLQNGTIDARIGTNIFNSGDNLAIGTVTNHSINFYTNNVNSSPRLTIASSGDATFSGTVNANNVACIANTTSASWPHSFLVTTPTTSAGIYLGGDPTAQTAIIRAHAGGSASSAKLDIRMRTSGGTDVTALSFANTSGNATFSGTVTVEGNRPVISTRDLIETLSTLRASTLDETVDVRQALASACDKLIEKFESMQEVATQEIEVDG